MFKVQANEKPKDHTVVLDKEAYEVLADAAIKKAEAAG